MIFSRPTTDVSAAIISPAFRPVRADVIFGNPARSCRGTGICRIELAADARQEPCGCSRARAWIWPADGAVLRMAFCKQSLCPVAEEQHFLAGAFFIPVAVPLPPELMRHIGSPALFETAALAPGRYALRESGEYIWLEVPLVWDKKHEEKG